MLNALDQRAPQRLDLVASRRPGMSTQQYADLALAHAIATGEEVRVISRDKESAAAMTRRAVDILRGLGLDVTPRLQTDREDRTR